jgi:hypothetical protein
MESNFECELCNKKYKSYQSLWNHNKKIHHYIHDLLTLMRGYQMIRRFVQNH